MQELTTISTFDHLPEAELAKLHLLEEGIDAKLVGSALNALNGMVVTDTGIIELKVPNDQVTRAEKLFAEHRESLKASRNEELSTGSVQCLSCSAVIPEGENTCPSCGWSYTTGQETATTESE